MDDVTRERKLKEGRGWTPVEALELALESVKRGEISPQAVVVCIEHQLDPEDPNSNVIPVHFASSMNNGQLIAMLEVQKCMAMQRWLGPMWTGVAAQEGEE